MKGKALVWRGEREGVRIGEEVKSMGEVELPCDVCEVTRRTDDSTTPTPQ
jgi:hypothetical protein